MSNYWDSPEAWQLHNNAMKPKEPQMPSPSELARQAEDQEHAAQERSRVLDEMKKNPMWWNTGKDAKVPSPDTEDLGTEQRGGGAIFPGGIPQGAEVVARYEPGPVMVDPQALDEINFGEPTGAWNAFDLLAHHKALAAAAYALMEKKNHDYAGHRGLSPFANFETSEALGVVKTEQGIMVRLLDKVKRICTFLEAGEFKVEDEKLDDTVLDLINYTVILSGFLAQKAEQA